MSKVAVGDGGVGRVGNGGVVVKIVEVLAEMEVEVVEMLALLSWVLVAVPLALALAPAVAIVVALAVVVVLVCFWAPDPFSLFSS